MQIIGMLGAALLSFTVLGCGGSKSKAGPSREESNETKAARTKTAEQEAAQKRERRKKRLEKCHSEYEKAARSVKAINDPVLAAEARGRLEREAARCLDYSRGKSRGLYFRRIISDVTEKARWKKLTPKQRRAELRKKYASLTCDSSSEGLRSGAYDLCRAKKDPLTSAGGFIRDQRSTHKDALKIAADLRRTGDLRRCRSRQSGLNPIVERDFIPAVEAMEEQYPSLSKAIVAAYRAQLDCITCDTSTPASKCAGFLRLINAAARELERARKLD